jgi:hypothetical protein
MSQSLGSWPWGSLKARVNREIRELGRANPTLRQSRYSLPRRCLRASIVGRSLGHFLGLYMVVLLAAIICEWAINRYFPSLLSGYYGEAPRNFVKDIASYLITAQIGILAIVSVAVGVVTLLSQRDYGSAVNTDIRLYYVESYSYELAISGVALLVVLTTQLFWPAQHVLHAIGWGGPDYSFKLALSALHTLWFSFNLMLFLQFITTTLRFVEPNSREVLRERYSANEVIPRDAKKRLLRALYFNAPRQIFGEQALKDGPYIYFGYGLGVDDSTIAEITTVFSRPTQLVDVWLQPLEWVILRWQKRVRMQPRRQKNLGQPLWVDQLTILSNFDVTLEGRRDWVFRRGGVPFTSFEKWIIRLCFRFVHATGREADMPTPENFVEQLVDKLVTQTEEAAATGFRAALDEVIRYHRFILAAQNTKDDGGKTFNLAEVGGIFSRPDAEWVQQYRRAFIAAADKIGSDTSFMDRLSNLATRLVPDDSLNFSQRVLETILDLGVFEVIALEDWVTKRAVIGAGADEIGSSATLTGSDKRAYENVLIGFVGGWETLAQYLISSFGIARRPSTKAADEQWAAFGRSLPVFQKHLQNAAYFFASAVWNDDALGADRFRDLLLRWLQPFYANLQTTFHFSNTLFLMPDLLTLDWAAAQVQVASRMRFHQELEVPGPVFGVLLWELHCDVVCVSGLVALHWYATGQQPSETAAQAAIRTLHREKRTSDGSDLTETTPKTTFRLLFDFAIRYALNPRFAEGRYSATIDSLVGYLTNLATPRLVSGRIYGGFGIDGFDTLRPVLLAAMAANLSAHDDDGVASLIEELKNDPTFHDDKSARNFIWTMRQMVQALSAAAEDDVFKKAVHTFSKEIDLKAATEGLSEILAKVAPTFEALRKEKIRTAPLDEGRMELVRRRVTESVLAGGPGITCFREYPIRLDTSGRVQATETEFGKISRGSFVRPEMSGINFDELPGIFVEASRSYLTNLVWYGLSHRPKRVVSINISKGTSVFWRRAVDEAPKVGPEPILLIPYSVFGAEILAASYHIPGGGGVSGFEITKVAGMHTGGGTAYLGTIEGIHIYGFNAARNLAVLCSRHLLRGINYGIIHGENSVFDFWFIENEDPENSYVRLKFAQGLEWADDVFVQFDIAGITQT